jgi:hypothetical protein
MDQLSNVFEGRRILHLGSAATHQSLIEIIEYPDGEGIGRVGVAQRLLRPFAGSQRFLKERAALEVVIRPDVCQEGIFNYIHDS